jgi:hypothetical protein
MIGLGGDTLNYKFSAGCHESTILYAVVNLALIDRHIEIMTLG